jgi:hypothetical protein
MLLLDVLRRDHLDIIFNSTADIRTRIVDRPGLWMQQAELAKLVEDVRTIARATLPDGDLTYGVLGGDPQRLAASVLTILYDRKSGKPVAFNALAWLPVSLRGRPVDVLHLGLVMIDPGERSRGLSWILYGLTCFALFLRHGMRPIWISSVTQVPSVFGVVTESFADVYPGREETKPTFEHTLLARQIMAKHRSAFGVGPEAEWDEARFVMTNSYTGGSDDLKKTFDEAPKHRKDVYNDWMKRQLDYDRGDDVLQLGQVNMKAAQAYMFDMVPKSSLPGVAVGGVILGLQACVLPVLHWFNSKQAWGSLRPAGRTK